MKIGLAYALEGEIESILRTTDAKQLETVCGVAVYEIAPDVLAYVGGVGKVNAAMSAQLFIDRYHPDWIISAGVAGCFRDLPIGAMVLADSFIQHDVDTTAVGDPIGFVSTVDRVEFPTSDVEAISALLSSLGVEHLTGRVATGDWFAVKGERSAWVRDTFHPDLVEMEGCAIAQVCLRNGTRFVSLKSVSDHLFYDSQMEEYFDYSQAVENLGRVVLPFARLLQKEEA